MIIPAVLLPAALALALVVAVFYWIINHAPT